MKLYIYIYKMFIWAQVPGEMDIRYTSFIF